MNCILLPRSVYIYVCLIESLVDRMIDLLIDLLIDLKAACGELWE